MPRGLEIGTGAADAFPFAFGKGAFDAADAFPFAFSSRKAAKPLDAFTAAFAAAFTAAFAATALAFAAAFATAFATALAFTTAFACDFACYCIWRTSEQVLQGLGSMVLVGWHRVGCGEWN
jgi:hypothetical protein